MRIFAYCYIYSIVQEHVIHTTCSHTCVCLPPYRDLLAGPWNRSAVEVVHHIKGEEEAVANLPGIRLAGS